MSSFSSEKTNNKRIPFDAIVRRLTFSLEIFSGHVVLHFY